MRLLLAFLLAAAVVLAAIATSRVYVAARPDHLMLASGWTSATVLGMTLLHALTAFALPIRSRHEEVHGG